MMKKFKLKLHKEQYGYWGVTEVGQRNWTVEAETEEEALEKARMDCIWDKKLASKRLANGDGVRFRVVDFS